MTSNVLIIQSIHTVRKVPLKDSLFQQMYKSRAMDRIIAQYPENEVVL
jgi:hypothetical protein